MLSNLFIAALWSPAWKRLTSWLLFVMFKGDGNPDDYYVLYERWANLVSIEVFMGNISVELF